MECVLCNQQLYAKEPQGKNEFLGGLETSSPKYHRMVHSKKSDILTKDQLNKVLTECFDPEVSDDLLSSVIIVLMFSIFLRQYEVIEILVSWVKIDSSKKRIYIDYKDSTKLRVRGFGYMLPPRTYKWFVKYVKQIDRKTV